MKKIISLALILVGFIWIGCFLLGSRKTKTAVVVGYVSALRGKFAWKWREGLPDNVSFKDALSEKHPDWFQLGRIDLAADNPLPDFLPAAIYHYEANAPNHGGMAKRIIMWTAPEGVGGPKVILYSNWSVTVIKSDSMTLPEWAKK